MKLEQIIYPMTLDKFFIEHYNKKHFVIRGFKDKWDRLYSWDKFNDFMNGYPKNCGSLQIIDPVKNVDRWCLDKSRKAKRPLIKKQDLFNMWKNNKSFVLPIQETQSEYMNLICKCFEKYWEQGQANIYCSPGGGSKSFPAHVDQTDNFLFHVEGDIKWTMYKEFAPEDNVAKNVLEELYLENGDLLYIPKYQFHKAESMSPRISISIHFSDKKDQDIKNFKITPFKESKRDDWYNWKVWEK